MNRLERLASKNQINPSLVLQYLQEYGIISDNCWQLDHVANEKEAHKFIIKEYKNFKKWIR
jgi:hypothetical protein